MFEFLRKYRKTLKLFTFATLTTSVGWSWYAFGSLNNFLARCFNVVLSLNQSRTIPESLEDAAEKSGDLIVVTGQDEIRVFKATLDTLKYHYSKRLVDVAQRIKTPDYVKEQLFQQLAGIKLTPKFHELLYQEINAKTAISLAHLYHLAPPPRTELTRFHNLSSDQLLDSIQNFLLTLYKLSRHRCISYFLVKVFSQKDFPPSDLEPMEADALLTFKKYSQSPPVDYVPLCLDALLHHSNFNRDLIVEDGLQLLYEIYDRYKSVDSSVIVTIARLLSNLTCDSGSVSAVGDALYQTGWVTVLTDWLNDNNFRISVPAARALFNLHQEGHQGMYGSNLFPLNSNEVGTVDVVFIHGLRGGVFHTWRQRNTTEICIDGGTIQAHKPSNFNTSDPDLIEYFRLFDEYDSGGAKCHHCQAVIDDIPSNVSIPTSPICSCHFYDDSSDTYTFCWPRDWLAVDCPNVRIIGVHYDTYLSGWAQICPLEQQRLRTLDDRSGEVLEQLVEAGLGRRPIVWVAHSMGGLVVKNLLNKAFDHHKEVYKKIFDNSRGIVFYSTPHSGSSLAKFNQASALVVLPSTEVQELQLDSPKLLATHEKFLKTIEARPDLRIVSFVETKPTAFTSLRIKVVMVDPKSGNPGVGEYYEIPLDHLSICKPSNKHSFLYQRVLQMLREVNDSR